MAVQRNRAARSGTYPREARIPESENPTADLPGPDLNEGVEKEISVDENKETTDGRNPDDYPEDDQPKRPREDRRRNKQTTEGLSR